MSLTIQEVVDGAQVTVYSKNHCPGCEKMKSKLRLANIPYTVRNIDTDPEAKTFVIDRGHRSVPVVYLGDQVFDTTHL